MNNPQTNCNPGQLFSKLLDEVGKFKCWKTQVDNDILQKERRLQENKTTMETQRNAIQELQVWAAFVCISLCRRRYCIYVLKVPCGIYCGVCCVCSLCTVWKWKSQHEAGGTDQWKWGFDEQVRVLMGFETLGMLIKCQIALAMWFSNTDAFSVSGTTQQETCVIFWKTLFNEQLRKWIYVSTFFLNGIHVLISHINKVQ